MTQVRYLTIDKDIARLSDDKWLSFFSSRFHLPPVVSWFVGVGRDGDVWSQTADGGMYHGTMPFTDTRFIEEFGSSLGDGAHSYVGSRMKKFVDDILGYDGVPVVVLPPSDCSIQRSIPLPRRIGRCIDVHVPVSELVNMLEREYTATCAQEKSFAERVFGSLLRSRYSKSH